MLSHAFRYASRWRGLSQSSSSSSSSFSSLGLNVISPGSDRDSFFVTPGYLYHRYRLIPGYIMTVFIITGTGMIIQRPAPAVLAAFPLYHHGFRMPSP